MLVKYPSLRLIILIMALMVGCATGERAPEPRPGAHVLGWYQALRDAQPDKAHAYLDAAAQKRLPLDRFKRLYYKHQKYLVAEARAWLSFVKNHAPREEAWVQAGDVRIRLIKTEHGWRITAPSEP